MSARLATIAATAVRTLLLRLRTRRSRRAALAIALLAPLLLIASTWLPLAVPSYEQIRARHRASAAFLLDRHGNRIDSTRRDLGERRGAWRPLAEVSPAVIEALVAGEDRRFRAHGGVDLLALAGALRDRVLGRNQRGASTLSMQLATLLIDRPRPRGTLAALARKWLQMRTAHAIERGWSKEQILEAYLNRVGLRGEVVGIDAAAGIFAGKSADALDADEATVLVALLPDPNATPARVADRACTRRRAAQPDAECGHLAELADAMLARRMATAEEPHLAPQLAQKLLQEAGSSRRSTLDAHWQAFARDALANQLARLAERNVRDGAVLVVDNRDGAVLAYVGSAGPKSKAPTLDGVAARRQAGSTLKPFLYEMAIEQGLITAASLLDDSPIHLDTASGTYIPQDYDREFKGLVSARTALASSLNVPAVRTLVLTGVEPFRSRLVDLGYRGIDRGGDYYGYSLALGSAEVSLWEQAEAYARLARGGRPLHLHVVAEDGAEAAPAALSLDPAASFVVADILSDRAARGLTFGLGNTLETPFWSAAKTGTSKDMRDNWCIGFSERYTIAVWVGNFEGDAMREVSGVTGAAPVWQQIMLALHAGDAPSAPSPPPGVVARDVQFRPALESARREWFLAGSELPNVDASLGRQRKARIEAPGNGMVIALDPDIPEPRQRVALSAEGDVRGMHFELDDKALGDAGEMTLWKPAVGAHRLALVDAEGKVADRILFTVR